MKEIFFTNDFYENPILALDVFNELKNKDLIEEQEMYESGEYLSITAVLNKDVQDVLSPIINDFSEYTRVYNKRYADKEDGYIGLCLIHQEHSNNFERECEIMWDDEFEEFVFARMLNMEEE